MDDLNQSWETLLRIGPTLALKFAIAVLCGGAIGFERERLGKSAGLRTTVMVCVGGMLFTVVSIEMARAFGGDSTRIAAQIITGVGFLGAGTIMRGGDGKGVQGVTTAALIWVTTALGMLIGIGYFIIAATLTVLIVLVLLFLSRMELGIRRKNKRVFLFGFPNTDEGRQDILELVNIYDDVIAQFSISANPANPQIAILNLVFVGYAAQRRQLMQAFYQVKGCYLVTGEQNNADGPENHDG